MKIVTEYPHFFTATNLEWKKLLQQDKYKDQVIDSFRFLAENERIRLYAFVIMNNHLHLIWQMGAAFARESVQRDFLKYTAKLTFVRIIRLFGAIQGGSKRPAFPIMGTKLFEYRIAIAYNFPAEAQLYTLESRTCRPMFTPEEYKYSSAVFYETGFDNWGFLTHYKD
jgi:REP element-mobilizing transposase RayT